MGVSAGLQGGAGRLVMADGALRRRSRRAVMGAAMAGIGTTALGLLWGACRGVSKPEKRPGMTGEPGGAPTTERTASAPGVTIDTVTLGSIYPLSGPAAGYAPIVQAMDAYFKRVTDEGGVRGRAIKFVVADDELSPSKTILLAKRLIEQDGVFALVGNLGTGTTSAIADYTTEQRVPLLYVMSGGSGWDDFRHYPYTMALELGYAAEARILGKYITATWPGTKVGVLYQNDDFGRDCLAYRETIGAGNPTVAAESYGAGVNDVGGQIVSLRSGGAEVLLLAAVPRQAGLALKAAADLSWKPHIIMTSVAADPSLFSLAGGAGNVEGVFSSTWLRPHDDGSRETQQVESLLTRYAPQLPLSQSTVAGYLIGALMVETLRRAGLNPTRESLIAAAESFEAYSLPQLPTGSTVSTSKTNHAPVKSIQLLRAAAGKFVSFGEAIS